MIRGGDVNAQQHIPKTSIINSNNQPNNPNTPKYYNNVSSPNDKKPFNKFEQKPNQSQNQQQNQSQNQQQNTKYSQLDIKGAIEV